jgi:hypothetical protein
MSANTLSMPMVPDFFSRVESHFQREFSKAVHDWSHCVEVLTHWEDEQLLDNPTPELLARHKQTVERLLRFGRFLSLATMQADFPDRELAGIVAATESCLRDKLALWHGANTTETERARILKGCLNES